MEENEEYLGGISSPYLKKGVLTGYGIYATNMRIFGIKNRKTGVAWLAGAAVGGLAGGGAGGVLGARGLSEKMSREQNMKTISELYESKDFEMKKDQIATIEVTKPRLFFGHLKLTSKSGEVVSVKIGEKGVYEQVKALMGTFFPEALGPA